MSREYSVECYGHAIPNSYTVDKNITLTGCSFDESDNYEPFMTEKRNIVSLTYRKI